MAEEEKDDDVVEEGGGKKKKMIMIIGGVLALAIAAGAGLYFTGFFKDEPAPNAEETATTEESADEEVAEQSDDEAEEGASTEVLYHELKPPFMVNFSTGNIRVLKVTLSLMAKNEQAIDGAKLHNPVIRNNILMLLSSESLEVLKTADGKAQLQVAIKDEINKVLTERKVSSAIDEVFFTELVMQ